MSTEPRRGRSLHIALAIEWLHEASGGAERVLADVANGLFRRGHQVTVITYQSRKGPSFYPLDFGVHRIDARVRHVEASGRGGAPLASFERAAGRRPVAAVPAWLLKYGPRVYRLRQALRIVHPDVVVGFMPSMFPYVTLAAIGTRSRAVASIHNVPYRELGLDPKRWDQNLFDIRIRRWSLRRAAATTVLLPSFVSQLPPDVQKKTFVIPNMIQPSGGTRADVTADMADNTILAVGRLSPAKDHATLIRAWAQIAERYPTWRVRIIGNGPLREALEDLGTELGVQRLVIDEPTSHIRAAYASAKLLAMPSLHEGFGLVTAEAMACGLPVIGFSDCEGTNEIILPDVNGLLVEPDDDRASAFASALSRLIEDDDLRIRLGAQAPATTDRFAPSDVLDRWESMLRQVASK